MMEATALLWGGAAGAVAAISLLRLAWSRPRRSLPLNAAAWGLLALGLLGGAQAAGAWGLSIVSLAATGCAFLLLGHAALTAPAGKAKASARRAHALPDTGEPLYLGRRFATFLLSVPAALIASLLLALAGRGLAGMAGWREADSNVLALFLTPIVWSVLLVALLMKTERRGQAALLAVPAATGALLLLLERVI